MTLDKLSVHQSNWYAVYTRSRAEKKLHLLLKQKNVECFLPLKKTLQQRSDRRKWVQLPLIPSYVFVRVTQKEHFYVLNTPGAVCYVCFEGRPVAIPEEQISSLINFTENKPQDVEIYHGAFEQGDIVEVNSGPLKGIKAEVVEIRGRQRLLLRFSSLGYCVHVEASAAEMTTNAKVVKY